MIILPCAATGPKSHRECCDVATLAVVESPRPALVHAVGRSIKSSGVWLAIRQITQRISRSLSALLITYAVRLRECAVKLQCLLFFCPAYSLARSLYDAGIPRSARGVRSLKHLWDTVDDLQGATSDRSHIHSFAVLEVGHSH